MEIPRNVKIAIAIILVIALLIVTGKIIRELKKPANANYVEGGGPVATNFNAAKYAKSMFDVIDGLFTSANSKNKAAEELMRLTDNELIAVYNYWNDEYSTKTSYGEKFGTLPNSMSKEQNVPFISVGETNSWKDLQNRFARLNLI